MELLDMTSGIRDVGGPRPWQAELRSIANDPLLYTPGTETSYSDANYDLLGELIEQWTGERYGTFIQDQILRPLGMSETQELGRSATVPNQAVGYDAPRHGRWRKAKVQNGPAMYASAGMVSTAQDMATYMTALLSGRILDPATYELMWTSTPTLQYGVNPPSNAERGLGWDTVIDTSAGPTEVAKSGQVPGYNSELILFPSSDSGVFVSFNSNITAVGIPTASAPCRWPSRCTRRPRPGPLREGDFARRRGGAALAHGPVDLVAPHREALESSLIKMPVTHGPMRDPPAHRMRVRQPTEEDRDLAVCLRPDNKVPVVRHHTQ